MTWNMEEARALEQAISRGRYPRAYAMLRRRTELMARSEAELCLQAALYRSPLLFRSLLEKCVPGEHTGSVLVKLGEDTEAQVDGTLLVLAAALDRPDLVRILLEAGYDCNSAGLATQEAYLYDPHGDPVPQLRPGSWSGIRNNTISVMGKRNALISCATPLAAAVACGSRRAASVLLGWPGVWKEESSAVCRAAVLALELYRGDPRQTVVGQIFGVPPSEVERLPETRCLHAGNFADFCEAELLRSQLEHGFCGEEDVRAAFQRMGERIEVPDFVTKLRLLEQHFLQLCRERTARDVVLRYAVRHFPESDWQGPLEEWKRLSGEEGDLSVVSMQLRELPDTELRQFLRALGPDMGLVMDADSFAPGYVESKSAVIRLLKRVRLRYNQGLDGISSLTLNLVQGSVRRFWEAARLGALRGEDPVRLTQYLRQEDRQDLMAAALAYGGGHEEKDVPWKTETSVTHWFRCWRISWDDYQHWLQELACQELPEEECLRRLRMMRDPFFFDEYCFNEELLVQGPSDEVRLMVTRPEAALFCGTQAQPARLALRYMPEILRMQYFLRHEDAQLDLRGTPLCLAAAMGRTATVRLLLDAGFSPDEHGSGVASAVYRRWDDDPCCVTPLMAAILFGQEETARLLLEAGAEMRFQSRKYQPLLDRCGQKDLAERLLKNAAAQRNEVKQ